MLNNLGITKKEGVLIMNKNLLERLVNKASEMALANKWGENAFKINMMILEMDSMNSAKCLQKAYTLEPLLKYAVSLAKIYSKIGKHEEVNKLYKQILDKVLPLKDIDAINSEFTVLLQR